MMLKIKGNEFPLVALVLIALSLVTFSAAIHRTGQMVSAINYDEAVEYAYQQPPYGIFENNLYDSDFDLRVPELTPVDPMKEIIDMGDGKVKEIDLPKNKDGIVEYPLRITVDEYQYNFEFERVGMDVSDSGRVTAVLASYGPRTFALYIFSLLSIFVSIALFTSHRRGYINKRNVIFIKVIAVSVGFLWAIYFASRLTFLINIQFFSGADTFIQPYIDPLFIKSIVLPGLLSLAALIGITNLVLEYMKKAIALKEENDGTI